MDYSQHIKTFFIALGALILAVYLGIGAATNQTGTTIKVIVVIGGIICAALGHRIWILIPLTEMMYFPVTRGFFAGDLAKMLIVGFSVLMFMMRKLPTRWSFGELEFWCALLVLCIIQVYARNPVGLNIMGASSVGARPYFMVVISLAAAIILGNLKVEPKEIRIAMWATILGYLATIPLWKLRAGFSDSGPVAKDYSGFKDYDYGGGAGRDGVMKGWAEYLSRVVSAFISPLRACFHPFWLPIVLFAFYASMASGFRNTVGLVGLTYLVAIFVHGGIRHVIIACMGFATLLVILAIFNAAYPLPPNVQRAMTPFPGTWEKRYKDQAEISTQWRVEMWEAALLTDKYIQNKWLGDGLGMTRKELKQAEALSYMGGGEGVVGQLSVQQENMMVNGDYHSGPIQTIRTVGYLGLAVLLMGMFRLSLAAYQQILRCKGTEWQSVAYFFCIPQMVYPIFFTFFFGQFGEGVSHFFIGVATIRLMQKNLPLPAYKGRNYVPLVLTRSKPLAVQAIENRRLGATQ